jgi:hypothetical protein
MRAQVNLHPQQAANQNPLDNQRETFLRPQLARQEWAKR